MSAVELQQHRARYPLADGWDAAGVARFLHGLTGVGRFALEATFMSKAAKADAARLFAALEGPEAERLPEGVAALVASARSKFGLAPPGACA